MIALKKKSLLWVLIGLILAGCSTPSLQATQVPIATRWVEKTLATITVVPVTLAPVLPTPTEIISATPLPSQMPQETPTQTVVQITPIVTGPSESPEYPSPDSRWLPYIDFQAQTLHFIDTSKSSICDFPSPIQHNGPDRFMAWLPDGRVVFQAASGVETGLPCSTFNAATPQEILILDHSDPSFSPDGHYQVVAQPYTGASRGVNEKIDIKDVATGKNLVETVYMKFAGGGGSLPGYWLDASHFLIPATVDQGPLLLTPGKSAIKIATDIFHLPLKPGVGENNFWQAITSVAKNAAQFHLIITDPSGDSNPLQIYHSETGQVETLPYLASQGHFSNDGHSLLVAKPNDLGQQKVFIRPIDPAGGAFQPFRSQDIPPGWWSPDGSRYYQVSQDLTTISVYTSPDSIFLGAWRAPGYELWPSWSPDGKYLAVWGRKHLDYNQESIFVIPMPVQK